MLSQNGLRRGAIHRSAHHSTAELCFATVGYLLSLTLLSKNRWMARCLECRARTVPCPDCRGLVLTRRLPTDWQLSIKMALRRKITKITKEDQTSRRKRTKGLFNKSHELGIRPSCKVFTFVLYTDVGQVRTYDSTGGGILKEVEMAIEKLVSHSYTPLAVPAPLMCSIASFPGGLAAVRPVLLQQQQASQQAVRLQRPVER